MPLRRSLFPILLGLLLLSACSTPNDSPSSGLEPQFGTAGYDIATFVATHPKHPYVFAAGHHTYPSSDEVDQQVFLRRYNRDGSLAWQRQTPRGQFVGGVSAGGVGTDASGNVYLLYSGDVDPDPSEFLFDCYLVKLDKNGKQQWRKALSPNAYGPLAVDHQGNAYVGTERGARLRKYAPNGQLVWETSAVPNTSFQFFTISPTGELYAAVDDYRNYNDNPHDSGYIRYVLQKYRSDGRLQFSREVSRSIPTDGIAFGGGAAYVAYRNEGRPGDPIHLNKYSPSGTLLAKHTLTTGDEDYVGVRGVSADAAGNVYLSGDIGREAGNPDPDAPLFEDDLFVEKYAPSGELVWRYRPRLLGTTETAFGVTARTTGEIYVVGYTDGRVNGENRGDVDAFLLRLSGQGKRVWSR